jgi:hypothetical protein
MIWSPLSFGGVTLHRLTIAHGQFLSSGSSETGLLFELRADVSILGEAGIFCLEPVTKEVTMKHAIILLGILLVTGAGICAEIDPSICNPGSQYSFYLDGRLKSCPLKDDFEINGVNCNQYSVISFYENGAFKSCVDRDYFKYNEITCNQYSLVSFFPTGKLDICTLFESVTIDGKTCVELQPISFFENGALKSCGSVP